METEELKPVPPQHKTQPNQESKRFVPLQVDPSKRVYDNLKFYPISILDAAIVAFLGVGLILAIIWSQTTLSATIAGVFGGYISKSAVSSLTNKDSVNTNH